VQRGVQAETPGFGEGAHLAVDHLGIGPHPQSRHFQPPGITDEEGMVRSGEGGDPVVIDVTVVIDQLRGIGDVVHPEPQHAEADDAAGVDGLGDPDVIVLGDAGEVLAVHGTHLQVTAHAQEACGVPIARGDVIGTADVGVAHAQRPCPHPDGQELIAVLGGILGVGPETDHRGSGQDSVPHHVRCADLHRYAG
jgi:hypothetical protein